MSFNDIFKTSFLEGFTNSQLGFGEVVSVLLTASVLALYIFIVYRVVTRRTFYSKNFNIALAVLAVITAAIILTIQFSIIVSLGMVGALSIVRFRTAIKDPMDLVFLFWSISIGIICGAGLAEIAVILSLIVTVGILLLDKFPLVKTPLILMVHTEDKDNMDEILNIVKQYCRYHKVKTRTLTKENLNLVMEVRTDKGSELLRDIDKLPRIKSVALLEHDGEVTY